VTEKAAVLNYRPSPAQPICCLSCTRKVGVPYMWCEEIGQLAEPGMVCDRYSGLGKER
jgi:hypothetical protein